MRTAWANLAALASLARLVRPFLRPGEGENGDCECPVVILAVRGAGIPACGRRDPLAHAQALE